MLFTIRWLFWFLIGNVIKYVYRAGIKTVYYKQDLLKVDSFMWLESIKDISNKDYYNYILLFTNMEHYKNKF